MKNNIKKWLPGIIALSIVIIVIIISLILGTKLPTLTLKEKASVSSKEIERIVNMLSSDDTKKNAESELNKIYEAIQKDDTYYLTMAKIIMANDNVINAVGTLNYVKNKTNEYYALMIKSTAGEFFTMGNVPTRLMHTAKEAANAYSNDINFQILAGELYYDKDNYIAALYYLDKALQIDPNNVDANYYYGLSIYLIGETEIGLSYMKDAQKLYKGNDKEFKKSIDNYIKLMEEGKK